jgi:uncharacterized protein (TIRG00374 family)
MTEMQPDAKPEEGGEPLDVEGAAGLPHGAKKIALFFLKYVLGISLIVWMVGTGKVDLSVLGDLSASLLLEALALTLLLAILGAVRVRYVLARQGIVTSLWQCFIYNCAGSLYSSFLPGGISGDAVRAYLFMKAVPDHRAAIVGAMVLDRLLGLVSMVFLGFTAACYLALTMAFIRPYLLGFAAIFVALIGGLALLHFIGGSHKHHDDVAGGLAGLWLKLRRVIASLRIHDYPLGVLTFVVVQSIVIHLLVVALIYLCSLHSRAGLDFLGVFIATPIGLLVNAIPVSPGGLGIGENAFEILYRTLGGANGGTSFLLARLFLYSPAVPGLAYVLWRMVTRRQYARTQIQRQQSGSQ